MECVVDKTDQRETYYPVLVDGRGIFFECETGHSFHFQFYDPKQEDLDPRHVLIRCRHSFIGDDGKIVGHDLYLVPDFTNHFLYGKESNFHLNFTGPSKDLFDKCPVCSRLLAKLNHEIEIECDLGQGYGHYKIVNWNRTFDQTINEFYSSANQFGFRYSHDYRIY